MIAAASFAELFGAKQAAPALWPWLEFLGNRHVAMLAGAGAGIWLLARREHFSMAKFNELLGPPSTEDHAPPPTGDPGVRR